jgi:hypothetical protein
MKTFKLKEASSTLTPYEKMKLVDKRARRENVKACSESKLRLYYKICLENHFEYAGNVIAHELLERKLDFLLKPAVIMLDSSQFTPYEVDFILENKDTPVEVVKASLKHPFPHLARSDTLTIYMVLAVALGVESVAEEIKQFMKACDTYYKVMPEILNDLYKQPGILEKLTELVEKVK